MNKHIIVTGGPNDYVGVKHQDREADEPFIFISPEDMLDFVLWVHDSKNIHSLFRSWHADKKITKVLKAHFGIDYEEPVEAAEEGSHLHRILEDISKMEHSKPWTIRDVVRLTFYELKVYPNQKIDGPFLDTVVRMAVREINEPEILAEYGDALLLDDMDRYSKEIVAVTRDSLYQRFLTFEDTKPTIAHTQPI